MPSGTISLKISKGNLESLSVLQKAWEFSKLGSRLIDQPNVGYKDAKQREKKLWFRSNGQSTASRPSVIVGERNVGFKAEPIQLVEASVQGKRSERLYERLSRTKSREN